MKRKYFWIVPAILLLALLGAVYFLFFNRNDGVLEQDGIGTWNGNGNSMEKVVFTAAGDFGAEEDTATVLDGMRMAEPDFSIALGDLSYEEASEAEWCDFVKGRLGVNFPFMLIAGNHDDGAGNGTFSNFLSCLPNNMPGVSGDYGKQYFFDYKNLARFIFVSPGLIIAGTEYDYSAGSERYKWLSDVIDEARNKNIPWVIVSMHKNCISVGSKDCEIGTGMFNLLVEKKVDLILQGHDHNYQRGRQLGLNPNCASIEIHSYNPFCVANMSSGSAYGKGDGPVVIIAGTGGQSLYDVKGTDKEAGYFSAWMGKNDEARKGFIKIVVNEEKLIGEFIGTTPDSSFTDSFQIVDLEN